MPLLDAIVVSPDSTADASAADSDLVFIEWRSILSVAYFAPLLANLARLTWFYWH